MSLIGVLAELLVLALCVAAGMYSTLRWKIFFIWRRLPLCSLFSTRMYTTSYNTNDRIASHSFYTILYYTYPQPNQVVTNSLLLTACDLVDVKSFLFTGSLGLFRWQLPGQQNECVDIVSSDREMEDQALKCARWASVAAFGMGVVLLICATLQQYIVPVPGSRFWMDASAVGIQICLGLVYVVWFSKVCTDFTCTYGDATTYLITTQGLWLLAGCLTHCMRRGRWERRDEIKAEREKRREEKAARAEAQRRQEENDAVEEEMDAPSKAPSETSSMQVGISVNTEDHSPHEV
jgi:hypothetical protein